MNRRDFVKAAAGFMASLAVPMPLKELEPCKAVAVGASGTLYPSIAKAIKGEAMAAVEKISILLLEDVHEPIVIDFTLKKDLVMDMGKHTIYLKDDQVILRHEGLLTKNITVKNGNFQYAT